MYGNNYGILGQPAPLWSVDQWINLPVGKTNLDLSDYENQLLYLYCFQSWCPGCHSHGFPALNAVKDHYQNNNDVAFVTIQTVFEGFHANTFDQAKEIAQKFKLSIPVGHDPGLEGARSIIMDRYRTGGTPWTILIDKQGIVQFNDFQVQPQKMVEIIDGLLE